MANEGALASAAGSWRGVTQRLRVQIFRSPLVRSSGAYALGNVLNRSVPFLLIPVLTRYLSPTDFGVTAMYLLALGVVGPLVGFSTDAAVARRYFDRDTIDFPNYVANCLYIWAATGVLVGVLIVPFSGVIESWLAIPRQWVWTLVIAAAARYIISVLLALWQMRQRVREYIAYSLAQTATALGLSVLLVVGLGFGWQGRVLGEIVGLVALGLVGVAILFRGQWVRGGINTDHLSHALRYGGGLVPHVYGGLLIIATDRLLITHMIGVDATGLYVVGVQIAMIIGVLEHSFNQAWAPWLFGVLKRDDPAELRKVTRITRVYNVSIVVLALGLAAAAPWLLGFFVGQEFRGATKFVLWLALGNAFGGMYKMVANQIYYANKTQWLAWITFATGVSNVALSYLLISANGAVGAAQATALAMLISYLLTAKLSARVSRPVTA